MTSSGSETESLYALMGKFLGLRIRSEEDLIQCVDDGLTVANVQCLKKKAGLTNAEIYRLIASRWTLNRRGAAGQPLTTEQAERAVRIARITAHAQLVFVGRPQYAAEWLREPKTLLGNRIPLQLLASECGGRAIEEQLNGIAHGMFA